VLSGVVCTSGKLIVTPLVVLVCNCEVARADKSNVLWHVDFLTEIFDVQAEIDHHLFTVFRVFVANQEARRDSTNHSTIEFQLGF